MPTRARGNPIIKCWRCEQLKPHHAKNMCEQCYHWISGKTYRILFPERTKESRKKQYWKNPEKNRENGKQYYQENKEKVLLRTREYLKRHPDKARKYSSYKLEGFYIHALDIVCNSYEHKCVKCGDQNLFHFQFDHINNGGTKERRSGGLYGDKLYHWILKHPEKARQKYQILCANCNQEKRYLAGSSLYNHRKY